MLDFRRILVILLVPTILLMALKSVSAGETKETSTTWEYKVATDADIIKLGEGNITAGLNKLGAENWELVSIRQTQFFFKRPGPIRKAAAVPPKSVQGLPGFGDLIGELLSAKELAKLNLTREQKAKYDLIDLEYRIMAAKLPNPHLDSGTRFIYGIQALRKQGLNQVEAMLTTLEQRAAFEEIRPRESPGKNRP